MTTEPSTSQKNSPTSSLGKCDKPKDSTNSHLSILTKLSRMKSRILGRPGGESIRSYLLIPILSLSLTLLYLFSMALITLQRWLFMLIVIKIGMYRWLHVRELLLQTRSVIYSILIKPLILRLSALRTWLTRSLYYTLLARKCSEETKLYPSKGLDAHQLPPRAVNEETILNPLE